jgi:type VI secretion system protein ImpK
VIDNNIDDPFGPSEGTIMRPRPGVGRRVVAAPRPAALDTLQPGSSVAAGMGDSELMGTATAVPQTSGPTVAGSGASLADFIAASDNPILQSAAPLLLLASRLGVAQQAGITVLRQQAVQEIRSFDDRLREAAASREDALVARYVLCTFVDAAVLNTPWGAQGDWASQSLLVMFHKEVSGGEKFFEILQRLRADPSRHAALIELLYVCLALGYEGRYRHDPHGPSKLSQLRHDLFELIRLRRPLEGEDLSPHWKGVEDRRNPIMRYVPWWVVAAGGVVVLTIVFIVLRARLSIQSEPLEAALSTPAVRVNYRSVSPPRASRLKELLAAEETAGRLTVEEVGDRTLVTLSEPNLFRSGSARVDPSLDPTLLEIGRALEQVPGRVLIVGHTDDQPVHSLQYADNLDLSRARAVAVAEVLRPVLHSFGRVEWQGVGSTRPRYPMDTPTNRARNRRVEIIHTASAESPR